MLAHGWRLLAECSCGRRKMGLSGAPFIRVLLPFRGLHLHDPRASWGPYLLRPSLWGFSYNQEFWGNPNIRSVDLLRSSGSCITSTISTASLGWVLTAPEHCAKHFTSAPRFLFAATLWGGWCPHFAGDRTRWDSWGLELAVRVVCLKVLITRDYAHGSFPWETMLSDF